MTPPVSLVRGFRDARVLVIGDAMLDTYLHGAPRELCREAPVPIVDVKERRDVPGGAANTAANLAALGARTDLVALVGDDREGEVLRDGLRAAGVDPAAVVVEQGRQTLSKQRVIAADQMVVRWDVGTTDGADRASDDLIRRAIRDRWASIGCVVISDYAYGVLTPTVRATLAELRRRRPEVVVVVDAKQPTLYRDLAPTVVKPNYAEAVRLLGLTTLDAGRVDQIAARGHDVLEPTGAAFAAITLDRDGAMLFDRDGRTFRSHARPGGDIRSAGAGDTFVAAMALAFANGADPATCLEVAQAASAAVLGRDGTACCTLDELTLQLAAERKVVDDIGAAVTWAELQRARGRRLVFTNGCFDILHRGHTAYLEEARSLGDALLVALNDDASVRRLKGPARPVNPLEDRAEVLAGLSSVDLVVPFADDRPDRLLERVRPDVFVKGGDYTEDRLPEAALVRELGGEVRILPFVSDRSTSGLIAKLRDGEAGVDPRGPVRPNASGGVGVSHRALRGTVLPSDAASRRRPRKETP